MKKLFFLLLVCIFFVPCLEVFAQSAELATTDLSQEEMKMILQNIDITVVDHEGVKIPIECFDVNDKEIIAIGGSDSINKTIYLYDKTQFVRGYTFKDNGSYGLEWNGENIQIHFVRGNITVEINMNGEIISIRKIQDSLENNSYWNDIIFAEKRTVNEKQFFLDNDNIFAFSYSKLIMKEKDGTETIIYDASNTYEAKTIICVCGIFIFFCIITIAIVKQILRKRKALMALL